MLILIKKNVMLIILITRYLKKIQKKPLMELELVPKGQLLRSNLERQQIRMILI